MQNVRLRVPIVVLLCVLLLSVGVAYAQETTAGLQGVVKDPSGALVPNAKVVVTSPVLVGEKDVITDQAGYYRFANLPPGNYTLTVTSAGFETIKRELVLEVGHLPTVDFTLDVGKSETIVEVSGAAPQIDVTTNVTTTNVTEDVIDNIPHGRSFQSVIQFAPAARNEPLMGNSTISNGTGSVSAGNGSNGGDHGFSVAGGSDSENSYLVEGQETANLIGGYSHTTVPFDFIQEVEIKNSGVQAEHGGALGGVVNVIMKKGSNQYHGSVFTQFENDAMDANPATYARLDPASSQTPTSWGAIDPTFQEFAPNKDKTSDVFPGFTLSGPIWKNKIFGSIGFNPEFNQIERGVNYALSPDPTLSPLGEVKFSQSTQTYYTYARIDAEVNKKIRVYGSWLYQLQKQHGTNLPYADSQQGYDNLSASVDPSVYSHAIGYTAPNLTVNTGMDYSITPRLIATLRFGYYFENYHDFGLPTTGVFDNWQTNGIGALAYDGTALPASLQEPQYFQSIANSPTFTTQNANKAIQGDANLAWYKTGWLGTHNFKFGYQLNRLSNIVTQHFNVPYVQFWVGNTAAITPASPTGQQNCLTAAHVTFNTDGSVNQCAGNYGYVSVYDAGDGGQAISYNHSLFVQDSWSIAKGLTLNLGLRVEKEYLPGENQPAGTSNPISFGWGDKVAPRVGAAWDPFGTGKMKIFGGYGQFYDQMKLNLAISSFGGQYWNQCFYTLDTANVASIAPEFDANQRYCPGSNASNGATVPANFPNGTPAGLTFIENQNFRANPTTCATCTITEEGVAPGLKPYKQHESTIGVDYQLTHTLAFEARYDRRRLDHVIEDSAIFSPVTGGETFVIVNPGQGINSNYDKFFNFLYGVNNSNCGSACPPTIPAQRNYDGVEFRLTKAATKHWAGMFSYTYSRLYGNYTGLTSSDQGDGGGGRNAPNNSRSFDEPFFSWDAQGTSSSGLLPTDRPNTFKGYVYYELGWLRKFSTDFGIFQVMYQGSPETSYEDVGYAFPGGFPTDIFGRGKWVDVSQNDTTGVITMSSPYTKRTPWFNQTDFNFQQNYKIGEVKQLSFFTTFTNIFNERAVTAVGEQIDSNTAVNYIAPGGFFLPQGTPFYSASFHPYDPVALSNAARSNAGGPLTINSAYGQPNRYQAGRTIRLGVRFTF
jgi:outer membrane receptor protein involved in Fe transport